VACYYFRLYRNWLGRWNTGTGIVKAVATSGTIAAWIIWQAAALVWATIIAASQLIDALRDVIPLARHHRAASDLANALDAIFIDTQFEWENIFAGNYTDDEISARRRKLMRLRSEAERTHFPQGHAPRRKLFALARQQAVTYLHGVYGVSEEL
jgi:hypothetical protein